MSELNEQNTNNPYQGLGTALLLQSGADPLFKTSKKETPFGFFIKKRDIENIKAIITHIAAISLNDLAKTLDFIPHDIVTIIHDYHSPVKTKMLNHKEHYGLCHTHEEQQITPLGYAVSDLQINLPIDSYKFMAKMKTLMNIQKIIILLVQTGADLHEKAYEGDHTSNITETTAKRLGSMLSNNWLDNEFKNFFAEKLKNSSLSLKP
jgi:hypothetical protein